MNNAQQKNLDLQQRTMKLYRRHAFKSVTNTT